ncbi:5-oxoprolinase subunit B family protein [Actinokineospora diospyrosa]|uniref:Sensor histidine kinase inhibitor, KipI family n=1 Tax=Actinokineospora diospyrosa TaxID=103728 RepID=A0ABT1IKI6_9PSEU|nr:allophanate hydrolase subunit 1 [Actinokineospora diospyrosa]MCP2273079.1 sensor histidine kinase inhibitor, KipI family [Actinokineospora diospyrosa]
MRLRRCGPDAVLVEVESLGEVAAARAALASAGLPGLVELVPAARTVLVSFQPGSVGLRQVQEVLDGADLSSPPAVASTEVVLPVVYEGLDLELVAETAGLSVEETVALHSSAIYTVAFCGFAPGFAYLTGLPEPLCQPRLETPRTRVPVGSVGVAGEFTGIYPRASPGGWRLVARLADDAAALFDATSSPAALLSPGDQVRFEVVS